MSWHTIAVESQTEAVEAVSNILMEAGAEGIQIEDAADVENFQPNDATVMIDWSTVDHRAYGAKIIGYFEQSVPVHELALDIQSRVQNLTTFGLDPHPGTVTVQLVKDEDWATEWQKYYHPVRVTRQLTVVPKWEQYQPENPLEQQIILDPGLAFGTGTHPTTQLMLQALEIVVRGDERLLDVGTGSGVLSIAAKLMGVKDVVATDIDEVAVKSAQTNLDLNPVAQDVQVFASDLLQDVPAQQFEIVVANMLTEVLLPLIPDVENYLNPAGYFLLSGIYYDKINAIIEALQQANYQVEETLHRGDWYGIICRLKPEAER